MLPEKGEKKADENVDGGKKKAKIVGVDVLFVDTETQNGKTDPS